MENLNLRVIGTSHIARESIEEINIEFSKQKPDIVALELDKRRYNALLSNEKPGLGLSNIRRIGLKGYLFALIGSFAQRKLGDYVGVAPGSEMKEAIMIAKQGNVRIALIDQEIEVTLKRFSQELTWKEKFRFIADLAKSFFMPRAQAERLRKEFDLRKVPSKEIVRKLIKEVKARYPNVYKVLIEERNKVMASRLAEMILAEPGVKVLAVVGAGHEEEINKLVEKAITKQHGKEQGISYSFSFS